VVTVQEVPALAEVRRLRHRQAVDRIDELRLVRRLSRSMPQTALARALAVSQPAIHKAIRRAESLGEAPEGFSGAGPYEIAERYAAGLIGRERLVDELSRWPYSATAATDGVDWLVDEPPGAFGEVTRAALDGLIDDDVYALVLEAAGAQRAGR
jgi:hypothetical protein